MKTKHTPGPWTLEAGRAITTESGTFCLTYGSEPGTGIPHFKSPTELDANARLIATAPELFEALEKLTAHAAHYATMPHAHSEAHRDVANALAIIAKAARD